MDETVLNPAPNVPVKRRRWHWYLIGIAAIYFAIAYLFLPNLTRRYYNRHPSLDDNPCITQTGDGRPGDPLNVVLIGTKEQIEAIMKVAGWVPAAAQGIRSDVKIAEGTLLSRPDANAPVSNLFLFGRKEDLAFEQPVGGNPRQRNHVRFWKTDEVDDDSNDGGGRPIWIGSASYDERVEFSTTTIQITHRISPDLDKERDHLFGDLEKTGDLAEHYAVDGFHKELKGKNGGGDPWYTDGALYVGVINANLK